MNLLKQVDTFFTIYFIFLLVIVMTVYPKFIESNLGYYKISLLIFIMSLPTIFDYFIQGKLSVFITANQKAYVLNIIQIMIFGFTFSSIAITFFHSFLGRVPYRAMLRFN